MQDRPPIILIVFCTFQINTIKANSFLVTRRCPLNITDTVPILHRKLGPRYKFHLSLLIMIPIFIIVNLVLIGMDSGALATLPQSRHGFRQLEETLLGIKIASESLSIICSVIIFFGIGIQKLPNRSQIILSITLLSAIFLIGALLAALLTIFLYSDALGYFVVDIIEFILFMVSWIVTIGISLARIIEICRNSKLEQSKSVDMFNL
jgi:hypothetical protein